MSSDLLARVRAEIDARLLELRPAAEEHERLLDAERALAADAAKAAKAPKALGRRGRRGSAAGAIKRAASVPHNASQQAIMAALEHGSHTLGELVLVTAIAASELREGVRHLQRAGTVTRTKREGRAAYALARASTG
jgi:hypothetical protein